MRKRARNANEKVRIGKKNVSNPFLTRFALRSSLRSSQLEKCQKDFSFVRDLVESLQKNKAGNVEELAAAEKEVR